MRIRVTLAAIGLLLFLVAWAADWSRAADTRPGQLAGGAVDANGLKRMLGSLGIASKQAGARLDFDYQAKKGDQEWDFTMSAVLSRGGGTIWVMAWLEEMPKKAARIPAAALLGMLSENDKLGNGKFFAYDRTNRRFLMQRVLVNESMSPARLREVMDDLAAGVMDSHLTWAVSRWSEKPAVRQSAVPPAPPAERRR